MKASKKLLFAHFGYGLDSVEAGLSPPGLLLLEHPQTTYSSYSMWFDKLPHPDTFTQAPNFCLYFCDVFSDIALLDGHSVQNQMKTRSVTRVHRNCSQRPGLPSRLPPVV